MLIFLSVSNFETHAKFLFGMLFPLNLKPSVTILLENLIQWENIKNNYGKEKVVSKM